MNNFKIGDSDELVTVTRNRWDEIEGENRDLRQVIDDLTNGKCHVYTYNHYDRYGGDTLVRFEVLTTDKFVLREANSVNKLKRELVETRAGVGSLKSKLRWLKTRSRWYMFRYYRSVQKQIERSI